MMVFYDIFLHPHNTYVQILVSNGLIGFSLLVFSLLFVIRKYFYVEKKFHPQKSTINMKFQK